jgi:exosortase A-associated hydrolase 1
MNFAERAVSFACDNLPLYGIVSQPEQSLSRGVVIVVGGPQYRVGSHRQFVLLARHLASCGVPVMRFDYRGMGDSEGDVRTFEHIESDIRHATDAFVKEVPAVKDVVIWGLCDAASAALFYAYQDPRISGLVLLNPWVRTDEGLAKAYLKHYYLARMTDRELWAKILRGRFDYKNAFQSLWKIACKALPADAGKPAGREPDRGAEPIDRLPLPDRMYEGIHRFRGKILLIISGNDLTAKEFTDLAASSPSWQKALNSPRVQHRKLEKANHTFSQREWRDQVSIWTKDWITSW